MTSRVLIMAAILMALPCAAMTQPDKAANAGPRSDSAGAPHHRPPPVRHLTEALSLTDEQAAAVRSIFESRRDEIMAQRESRFQEHCDMRAGIDAEIADVLTDEQRELWQDLKNRRPKEGRHDHGGKQRQRANRQYRRCNDSQVNSHS